MQYHHTQRAPLHYLLDATAVILLVAAWLTRPQPAISLVLVVSGCVVLLLLALAFRSLTVLDEGDRLTVRFGPLPLFRKSIPYREITQVELGKTSVVDGWGIHFVPGRGWTYNLWGFDCAVVHLDKRVIRIGSDDAEHLVEFLKSKMQGATLVGQF